MYTTKIYNDTVVHEVATIYYQVCATFLRSCYLTAYFYSIASAEALVGPL